MSPLRTLIVEDEPPARDRLRRLLGRHPDVEIVGEPADGDQAVCAIAELRPDLLFLDVELPVMDGRAVLRAVRDEWLPCTIFTTAYAEHAVEAFELHAVDYLLKPFSVQRFDAALERARSRFGAAPAGRDSRLAALLAGPGALPTVSRFLVKSGERYSVVRAQDITRAEAAGNYIVLHTPSGNHILRRTVNALETELDPRRFFRANRSTIVPLDAIAEIVPSAAGEHEIHLRDGSRIPLTRGLRELQERLTARG